MINPSCVRTCNDKPKRIGPVLYWMNRDLRSMDNQALLYAQQQAILRKQPLVVLFCWPFGHMNVCTRQDTFMMRGLVELRQAFEQKNIPFVIETGERVRNVLTFAKNCDAGHVVCDFSPLRHDVTDVNAVSQTLSVACEQTDARNIVPCFWVSKKSEYAAYTLRPKIHKALPIYLKEPPALITHPFNFDHAHDFVNQKMHATNHRLQTMDPCHGQPSGEKAAHTVLNSFIKNRLDRYHLRNDPNVPACSNLSAYLHFGQISALRIALRMDRSHPNTALFLEELIVRRELADNFCLYNPHYDSSKGFPNWAQKTLEAHARDVRPVIYTQNRLEQAATHDDLWNAAQTEMVHTGSMPGYLRMYWAKKIYEWSEDVDTAMQRAIFLNDKYQLDGRDPNGYAGIAWSVGGVHDRAWAERPIFGKIRTMTYQGCKRKFDVADYVERIKAQTAL